MAHNDKTLLSPGSDKTLPLALENKIMLMMSLNRLLHQYQAHAATPPSK